MYKKKFIANHSVDEIYNIAKNDGRWSDLFKINSLEEAMNDFRLNDAIMVIKRDRLKEKIDYQGSNEFRPVRIIIRNKKWGIEDGFHRIIAHKLLRLKDIPCEIKIED